MVKYQTIFPLVKNMISISYYNLSSTFILSIMQDKWIKGFKIEKEENQKWRNHTVNSHRWCDRVHRESKRIYKDIKISKLIIKYSELMVSADGQLYID